MDLCDFTYWNKYSTRSLILIRSVAVNYMMIFSTSHLVQLKN